MVQIAATHLPPDLPVLGALPVQRMRHSPPHRLAGTRTLSLKAETVMRLWTDIAESGVGQRREQAGAVQHARRPR